MHHWGIPQFVTMPKVPHMDPHPLQLPSGRRGWLFFQHKAERPRPEISQLTSHPDMNHSEPGKYFSPLRHLASQPHLCLSPVPAHRQGGPKPLFSAVVYPSRFHTPGNICLSYMSREEHNLMRNAIPDGSRDYYRFPLFDWMFFWVFLPCHRVILFLCASVT